jgi:hypothetical protein
MNRCNLLFVAFALASCQERTPPPETVPQPSTQDTVDAPSTDAHTLAHDSLEHADWKTVPESEGNDTLVQHVLLADKVFGARRVLLYASNGAANTCHACAPYVSVFEFRRIDSAWTIHGSDIAFAKAGAWGALKPENARIEALDDSSVAILLTTSFMGQGCLESSLDVYKWDSHNTHSLSSLQVGSSNAGEVGDDNVKELVDWNADVDLVPQDKGMPRLRVIRHGVEEGDSLRDTTWHDLDIKTKATLTPGMDVLLP